MFVYLVFEVFSVWVFVLFQSISGHWEIVLKYSWVDERRGRVSPFGSVVKGHRWA